MDAACDSHHNIKLGSFCRQCGNAFEFNMETRGHKPQPVNEFIKKLLAFENLHVSCDVETKHPPFLCRCFVMKSERYREIKKQK